MENSSSLPNSCSHPQHSRFDNAGAHVTDGGGSGGSSGGARYKLLSPARLPISRSTCITIPPGLSPTSFLESPVLLSSIKAEPSPTTGSLSKPPFMGGSGESVAISQEKNCSGSSNVDERTSRSFEFKFHTGSASSRFSSLTIPAGLKHHGPFSQSQDQSILQFPAPSVLAAHEHQISVRSNYELNQGGHSNSGTQLSSSDQKDSISIIAADRTSDDGYNWRKYGQKLVKGSEFPRSYYKCTYPTCEVKKIFERSPSGQITEIVYKGSHDHPKPAGRRHNPGALTSIQEEKFDKDFSFTGQDDKSNINSIEPNVSPALPPQQANEDGIDGSCSQIQNNNNDDIDEDDSFSKRRKMEDGFDFAPVVKSIREPRVVVQTVSEVDILDDGYRWRKYGQKVVRGNPNPRSYYKCTNSGCPVRKHVERASHDLKAVITTYEGKHNHDIPTAKNNNHEFSGTVSYVGNSTITTQVSGSISLDLGVGVNCAADNRTKEEQQVRTLYAEAERSQIGSNNSSMMVVIQAPQIPATYGIVNSGLNLYGSRENRVEGHNRFQTQPVHPSNQCTPNLGRILMGP